MRRLFVFCLFFLLFVSSAYSTEINRAKNHVILQGFNWESYAKKGTWYKSLQANAKAMSLSGFTAVWFPPATYSYDGAGVYPDSRGYIPLEYYNLNSKYGNQDDLVAAIAELKRYNVMAIADLVINHRGVSYWNAGTPIFKGPEWTLDYFTGGNGMIGQGAPDTGAKVDYAFDLDFTNPKVVEYLSNWMNWLKNDIGFSGWRYDFAKGYAGRYVGMLNAKTSADFSVAEYWTDMRNDCGGELCYNQDYHRQQIANWIDGTWKNQQGVLTSEDASSAFDFTTKGILQFAIWNRDFARLRDSQGRAPGLIGWWPTKAVTFIDNHDTGSTQNHWSFGNKDQVIQGYAYILTHPGTPTVFWDHFYEWGLKERIQELMNVRKAYGLNSASSLNIVRAEYGLYAATIDNKVAMKIGPNAWNPDMKDWELLSSGPDYAVWGRKGTRR